MLCDWWLQNQVGLYSRSMVPNLVHLIFNSSRVKAVGAQQEVSGVLSTQLFRLWGMAEVPAVSHGRRKGSFMYLLWYQAILRVLISLLYGPGHTCPCSWLCLYLAVRT